MVLDIEKKCVSTIWAAQKFTIWQIYISRKTKRDDFGSNVRTPHDKKWFTNQQNMCGFWNSANDAYKFYRPTLFLTSWTVFLVIMFRTEKFHRISSLVSFDMWSIGVSKSSSLEWSLPSEWTFRLLTLYVLLYVLSLYCENLKCFLISS